jgi:hypothetical protein
MNRLLKMKARLEYRALPSGCTIPGEWGGRAASKPYLTSGSPQGRSSKALPAKDREGRLQLEEKLKTEFGQRETRCAAVLFVHGKGITLGDGSRVGHWRYVVTKWIAPQIHPGGGGT